MRRRAAFALVAATFPWLSGGCGGPAHPAPPASPGLAARAVASPRITPPPPPTAVAPAVSDAELADADAAVTELAAALVEVEAECAAKWTAAEQACEPIPFASLAARYQRVFGKRTDPRATEGRIDALPRMGGPDETEASAAARMAAACGERCDLARRTAVVVAIEQAAARCATEPSVGRKACQELATRGGEAPSPAASRAAERCADECETLREHAKLEAERERTRPRTAQQSRACFRACMVRCTGGRIVPPLDRPYVAPADEWCGTCQFSCEADCAVR